MSALVPARRGTARASASAKGEAAIGATIIPDYARPAALMVPHYDASLRTLLEDIAVAASQEIGVILLSGDPVATRSFIARQPNPQRYSIVEARYDTPWIRDRAPIALKGKDGVRWLLPRMPEAGRPRDDALFGAIAARAAAPAPLAVAQGNLVAGPRGIALSTSRVLGENRCAASDLQAPAALLGIRQWIVFDGFPEEPTGHADVHARFLGPRLMAVAWHPTEARLQEAARAIEAAVRGVSPGIECLRIPLARSRDRYASLLNWVQIGRFLLMPTYELTPDRDIADTLALLAGKGFRVRTIASPTLDLGGSLHCLTASVFV